MTKAEAIQRLEITGNAAIALVKARDELRAVGADKAADYIQRALKSVQGAIRNMLIRFPHTNGETY